MTMPAGLHIVRKTKPGKPVVWYVYAWRGGPQILKKEGGAKPEVTAALTDLAAEKRKERPAVAVGTIADLIDRYTDSRCAEWNRLSRTTQANYGTWHKRIRGKFGDTPLAVFQDRRVRGDVLEWRDAWSHQPRSADAAITTFSALLSWGADRGYLPVNVLLGTDDLYDSDRSDIIWLDPEFAAFAPHASVEVQEGVDLAAATGLRRGDLVGLPWTAVGEHAIVWKTGKSRGKAMITIPLIPEARAVIDRIKARHEAEMAKRVPEKRKPLPATVLSNSYWQPWTPSGFGSRFNDAKQASGITVNLHDLRGTFATRLMRAKLTDDQIADVLGWTAKDVAKIRAKYVSDEATVIELSKRIAAASAAG